jgi:hypothetical protein
MTFLPRKDAGYVLLDALVGIALGGLVMSFVAIGLRQMAAAGTTLSEDATKRRETLSMLLTLRQWSEAINPVAKLGSPPPDDVMVFHRTVPEAGSGSRVIEAKVGIEPFGTGDHTRLILTIQNPQGQTESIELFRGSQMALAQMPVASPFVSRAWMISLRREPSTAPIRVQVNTPTYARTRCIAEPYLRECLP